MPANEKVTRAIKSFVRRSGRMTQAQKNALEAYWPAYGIEFSQSVVNIPTGFDALKLEIGIGNGDALIHMAAADPSSLYLGVEVHEPGIGRCLNNIVQQELANVRLIMHDAIEVMEYMIAAASLDRLLLFFPDPWHKKRHHKRRIVQPAFIKLVATRLKPGGILHMATDWENYAEQMLEVMDQSADFRNCAAAGQYSVKPAYRPVTKFERRGQKLGHGVWDLVFERK